MSKKAGILFIVAIAGFLAPLAMAESNYAYYIAPASSIIGLNVFLTAVSIPVPAPATAPASVPVNTNSVISNIPAPNNVPNNVKTAPIVGAGGY
jgi:hypothetical protein